MFVHQSVYIVGCVCYFREWDEHLGHVLLSHSFLLSICVPQLKNPLTCLAKDMEAVLCSSRLVDRIAVQFIVVLSDWWIFSLFRMWLRRADP